MALTANAVVPSLGEGQTRAYKMADNIVIYRGAIVALRRQTGTGKGYAKNAATNATTVEQFVGVAREKVDNTLTGHVEGGKSVEVYTQGVFGFPVGSLVAGDVGAVCYASDENTVTLTSTNNPVIGRIAAIDATYVWVEIITGGAIS